MIASSTTRHVHNVRIESVRTEASTTPYATNIARSTIVKPRSSVVVLFVSPPNRPWSGPDSQWGKAVEDRGTSVDSRALENITTVKDAAIIKASASWPGNGPSATRGRGRLKRRSSGASGPSATVPSGWVAPATWPEASATGTSRWVARGVSRGRE
jgi:hypothetical protein